MANYTPQKPGHTEAAMTYNTPAGASLTDTFDNDGRTILVVKNTGGSDATVTVEASGNCSYGFPHDVAVTSPSTTGNHACGPFSTDRFGTSVTLTWGTNVTDVTFALISIGGVVTGV